MLNGESTDELRSLSDYELIGLYRSGNQTAFTELALRYVFLIHAKAFEFYGSNIDRDDLFQEGLIALHSAVCSFKPESGVLFSAYASVCIRNKLVSAVRAANSAKNKIGGSTVSLDSGEDFISDDKSNPENDFIVREEAELIREKIDDLLSEKEAAVLKLYLEGMSYEEIALNLGIGIKACDNAMQRVRNKLKVFIG